MMKLSLRFIMLVVSLRGGMSTRWIASSALIVGNNLAASVGESKRSLTSLPLSKHELRVIQVQIVHRHGDRTPITPLLDEKYWASELVQADLLIKVASTTRILRDADGTETKHMAGGRGPFGKLTQLGLLQMVQVGSTLRDELIAESDDDHHIDDHGNVHWNRGRLFRPSNPLHPSKMKVFSTDFPRTIQSVQGTLVGLFPDPSDVIEPVQVDARHTQIMIPDPQPRLSREQDELERSLSRRPHLRAKEEDLNELAVETTLALKHLLSDDAFSVSFGIGEDHEHSGAHQKPLSWAQLSEITKCLQTRNLLPPSITNDMQHAISQHAAWRWFENLRHPRLAYLAMNSMVTNMVHAMQRRVLHLTNDEVKEEAPLYLYSAHDSTLIGLLCAFRLEQPAQWPEYGSYLKIELIEATPLESEEGACHFVRFSLNGKVLRCKWEDSDEPLDMIHLDMLAEYVATKGAQTP
jgi:hypothetical protein